MQIVRSHLLVPLACLGLWLTRNGGVETRALPARQVADDPALPAGVAARVGDELITLDEYKDYVLRLVGRKHLRDLVLQRLLAREAGRLALVLDPAEVEAEVERMWAGFLAVRHHGDAAALEGELAEAGFTPEEFRANFRESKRWELLQRRVCLATRVVGERAIAERFERDYGVGGVRVEVRHLFLNRARLRAQLVQQGAAPQALTPEALDQALRTQAQRLLAEVAAGADFEELARRESHDLSVHQNGGVIPGYNYQRYGEELAEAVRAAEVGVLIGPVETQVGLHLVRVESRRVTALADVRAEIAATLGAEPPSWEELRELEERLRRETPVATY